jgi:hypothetical protein
LDKGGKGGLKKGELVQVIRDQNDQYYFLQDSDFGPYVKQAWADALPDEEGLVRFDQFADWYDGMLAHIESIKAAETKKAAEAKAEAAAAAASMFSGDGMWEVPMQKLQDALQAAWDKGKTPLLIDATLKAGAEPPTPLESFYTCAPLPLVAPAGPCRS